MEIREFLKNKKFKKETRKTTEYGELSKEMSAFFHQNCFWIPWRYEMYKIREKFKLAKEENWKFKYFLGSLKIKKNK